MDFGYIITTALVQRGVIDIGMAILAPLVMGLVVGLILAAWTNVSVSAFVAAVAFVGASQVGSTLGEVYNNIDFLRNGDISIIF